jgi:hypothetical protein
MPGNGDVTGGSCRVRCRVTGHSPNCAMAIPSPLDHMDDKQGLPVSVTIWTTGNVTGGFPKKTLQLGQGDVFHFEWD